MYREEQKLMDGMLKSVLATNNFSGSISFPLVCSLVTLHTGTKHILSGNAHGDMQKESGLDFRLGCPFWILNKADFYVGLFSKCIVLGSNKTMAWNALGTRKEPWPCTWQRVSGGFEWNHPNIASVARLYSRCPHECRRFQEKRSVKGSIKIPIHRSTMFIIHKLTVTTCSVNLSVL